MDDTAIDALDLSVRAERLLDVAGIRTVADLRARDLTKIPGATVKVRKEIVASLAEHDAKVAKEAKDRVPRAKAALALCTLSERAAIFREMGLCGCNVLTEFVVKNPSAGLGAGLGALAWLILGTGSKSQAPEYCGRCHACARNGKSKLDKALYGYAPSDCAAWKKDGCAR